MKANSLISFAIFICLFSGILCNWQGESILLADTKEIRARGIYSQTNTPQNSHAIYDLYRGYSSYDLYHIILDSSHRNISKPVKIAEGVVSATISGQIATNDISVVAVIKNGKDYWLSFKESNDGGMTWKPDVNLDKSINARKSPIIVYDNNKGRIWIFYLADNADKTSNVVYITRAPGSTIFSNPKIISKTNIQVQQIQASISRLKLHVQWANLENEDDFHIMYCYSKDGGNSWSDPYVIENNSMYQFFTISSVYNNATVVHTSLNISNSNYRVSYNEGGNWLEPLPFRVGYTREVAICTNGDQMTVLILTNSVFKVAFQYIRPGIDGFIRDTDPPFSDKDGSVFPNDIHISCATGDNNHITSTHALVAKRLNGKYYLSANRAIIEYN